MDWNVPWSKSATHLGRKQNWSKVGENLTNRSNPNVKRPSSISQDEGPTLNSCYKFVFRLSHHLLSIGSPMILNDPLTQI